MRSHFKFKNPVRPATWIGALILFFLFVAVPAYAQQYPRWETSTGFSYAHINLGQQTATFQPTDKNYYGLEVNGSFNPRSYLRIILCDFSVQMGGTTTNATPLRADVRTSQVLFGPEFVRRSRKSAVFAHTLIGLTNSRLVGRLGGIDVVPDLANRTSLAFGFGGGLDIKLIPMLSVRAFQADYIPTRLSGTWESQFRASSGIILRFDYREAR